MEKLIPVINKLQDVFSVIGAQMNQVNLPQIVVIGSQSSGKSSVLENIVGRDFLPRGSGIVTRRPLVLQLNHIDEDEYKVDDNNNRYNEWAVFHHRPNEFFFNFDHVREEITRETIRLVGSGKSVSRNPINLKIWSPNVLNLTLVDLPGITRVAVGDQPKDIERQLRQMCLEYISNPNAIILAVSAANADLANSDGLQLAREVDVEGKRTLGVITKIDLMDKGTNAMNILKGKVVPLRLGFIGVVNRSQSQIDENVMISTSLKNEEDFFQNHPIYGLVAHKMGSKFLAKTLSFFLMHHIHRTLPSTFETVKKLHSEICEQISQYPSPIDESNIGAMILHMLTEYTSEYNSYIDGTIANASTKELYGGARISYVFHVILEKQLQDLNPEKRISKDDIRTAIRNAGGVRASGIFVSEAAFELLARDQISILKTPSLKCSELVYKELTKVMQASVPKSVENYNKLKDALLKATNDLLKEQLIPTQQMIEDLIDIELAYINTSHPDFVQASEILNKIEQTEEKSSLFSTSSNNQSIDSVPKSLRANKPSTDREENAVLLFEKLLLSYFDIIRKKINDTVPKVVMHFLVNASRKKLQNELISKLYKEELFDKLMEQDPIVAKKRKELTSQKVLLDQALDILNEVKDFQIA
eukprot:TRINITY_DN2623_c0_g1_i1.p1 TRINITY_DN2623_c0_g1~~TRINITY_DN2623_c0_g1_i1.p1  ORF type:complete len:671 (-),score=136.59 TRINITY_DN2623_c0_g1_i1:90-2024(-)